MACTHGYIATRTPAEALRHPANRRARFATTRSRRRSEHSTSGRRWRVTGISISAAPTAFPSSDMPRDLSSPRLRQNRCVAAEKPLVLTGNVRAP